ncbi:MAG: tetratricopeptide repeat-containing protein, partial [Alphaproteobacteria bacterium]|nr:tetratricopeptide repeat-containing protein [Alphaproteobacteria bacterium]
MDRAKCRILWAAAILACPFFVQPAVADVQACNLHFLSGSDAQVAGELNAAETLYLRAVETTALGASNRVAECLIDVYANLAALYATQGRLAEEAETIEKRLALRERRLGEGHPDLMFEAHDLAGLYMELRRPGPAAEYMEEVLVFDIETFGPDHPAVGDGHFFVALLWDDAGQQDAALPFYHRALEIFQGALP